MYFFPVELTAAEIAYISDIVDDILQESNCRSSDTVISFLKCRAHYPVQAYNMSPVLSPLHDFMLQ